MVSQNDSYDYTELPPSIATTLNVLMHSSGKTGADLARETGISRTYISNLLHGKQSNLGADTAQRLAHALGVATDTLVTPGRVQVRIRHVCPSSPM